MPVRLSVNKADLTKHSKQGTEKSTVAENRSQHYKIQQFPGCFVHVDM